MKWQIRLLKNAIIGIFPLAIQRKMRSIKRTLRPTDFKIDVLTVRQGLRQVEMLRMAGCDPMGKDYLEVGTGWSPVIPLFFALAGCRSLTLVDYQRLMDSHYFSETCRQLLAYKEEISQKLCVAVADIEQRLSRLSTMSLDSALIDLHCNYLAPYDLLNNDISEHSLDIVTSRAVLYQVPPQKLSKMFYEFNRILRQDGFMCHIIDNSDNWEHNDKSISRLNYLKYSQRTFDLISSMNPLDYQNRLRHSQYKKMIEDAGFRMVYDDSPPDDKSLEDLKTLKIHTSFSQFSKEDLAILTSYIVAAK